MQRPNPVYATHCIRELTYDSERHDWFAKLIEVETQEIIVIGDIGYILQFVDTTNGVTIVEQGEF